MAEEAAEIPPEPDCHREVAWHGCPQPTSPSVHRGMRRFRGHALRDPRDAVPRSPESRRCGRRPTYGLPDQRPRGIVRRRLPPTPKSKRGFDMRDDQTVEVESTELLRTLIKNACVNETPLGDALRRVATALVPGNRVVPMM